MSVTIQSRGDTAAHWTSANPVLHQREIGVETDTFKAKIGDGATAWTSLPYWTLGALAVLSVYGRTGAVTAEDGDYTAAMVGALALAGGNMLGWLGPKEVTLEQSGGLISPDAESGNSFYVELTSSGWVIEVPANPQPGQITFWIGQDPSGSRTFDWADGWNFGSGEAPTPSTTPSTWDLYGFKWNAVLGQYCICGFEPGAAPPPEDIAFSDSVASVFGAGIGNSIELVLPGGLEVGDAVVVGVLTQGDSNVLPTGFTKATTGVSVPSPLSGLLPGIFGTGSQIFGFYVQPGDLSTDNGGTAETNATITFTATGTATAYGTAAALSGYHDAVLPPGAIGRSTSVSGANTYVAPTTETVAEGSWEISLVMTGSGLTTTFPESLTARTFATVAVCIGDSDAPIAVDTTIGGETWGSNAGSVAFHAYTVSLNPA